MTMHTRFPFVLRFLLVVLLISLCYLPVRAQEADTLVWELERIETGDPDTLARKLVEVETETTSTAADQWRVSTYARLLELLGEVYEEDEQTITTLTRDLYVTLKQEGRESSLEKLMSAFHVGARQGLIREDRYAKAAARYLNIRQDNFSHGEAMWVLSEGRLGQGLPLLLN